MRAVGLTMISTGVSLLECGIRGKRVPPELARVATAQALSLGSVAAYYRAKGRIPQIFRLDSLMHLSLATAWIALGGVLTDSSRPEKAPA